jgi:hypothetical protein
MATRLFSLLSRRSIATALFLVLLMSAPGCVGLVAHLINAGWGDLVKARYAGLEEKKVAVVCVARSSMFGPSSSSDEIAEQVEMLLRQRVPKIQIIRQQQVNEWMDKNDWDQSDYVKLGRGIGADQIVGIDILSMAIHDGNTIYRGRSDIEVRVFDIAQGGGVVYTEVLPQIVYPARGITHVTDVSEGEFRRTFLEVVSAQIAHRFYDYDRTEDISRDRTFIGF